MPDETGLGIFGAEYVPNAQGADYHKKWAAANKAEAAKWAAFRDAVLAGSDASPPAMSSRYGKALVAAGKVQMSFSRFVGQVVGPPAPGPGPGPPPPPPPSGFYWDTSFEGAAVPADWAQQRWSSIFLEDPYSRATYGLVPDPFGAGEADVLRLRCEYDPRLPTDYTARQLVSVFRNPEYARSGYQQVAEETWYRVRFGFPAGTKFASGQFHWLIEWHTDGDTQTQGGNSAGIAIQGDYPLNPAGASTVQMVLRWASGIPSSPTYTYWPSSGAGDFGALQFLPVAYNQYYDMVFHVKWSRDPLVGLVEWWIDGTLKLSRQMATSYANPNLFNGQSFHSFGLYNYRYNITNLSDVLFARSIAGPTAASIGFAP